MKIIRPISITDSVLTSSNVPEAAPAAYNAGTTYALGDRVSVITGTTALVYESLQAGNLAHTPASSPTYWEAQGTTYSTYAGGTTYALGDKVISTTTHHTYESLTAGNLGNALTDTTKWLDLGADNRWAMFDVYNGTVTSHPYRIVTTIVPTTRVDAIALINIAAASVQITVTDAVDGLVYDQTYALNYTASVVDYYSYFFEDVIRKSALIVTDIPPYSSPTIVVTIDGGGATTECGIMVAGLQKSLGDTVYGAGIGLTDYSVKDVNAFGDYTLVQRPFAKKGQFKVVMAQASTDEVHRLLSIYRSTPIIWSASEGFDSTLIFGFYRDFKIAIANPSQSYLDLEIEGLT